MAETKTGSIVATPPVRFDIDSVSNPIHPEWFQGVFESQLGKQVGIGQFGVNYVTLEPGSYSALRHWHEGEDEFVFVLHGSLVLVDENGERVLNEGEYVGFPAGEENAHHLTNRSQTPATYLAIGSRLPEKDVIHYPDDRVKPVRR